MGRNVRNTREVLHDALLALVVEQPYESITVQQILDRAGVGRTTFYLYFHDKEDLLFSGMEPLREILIRRSTSAPGARPSGILEFAAEFFREGERVFEAYKALSGSSAGAAANALIYRMLVEVIAEGLRSRAARENAALIEPTAHWLAGSIMGVVEWWTQMPQPLSGAEMERLFLRLSRPALDALFSG